jgi:hypothetical protein
MECCDLTVLTAGDQVPEGVLDAGTDPSAQAIEQAVGTGRPVLVTLSGQGPGPLAAAAVYAYLGVRLFRTDETAAAELRQVLDMVATIQGTRQPSLTRRGLA